MKYKPRELMEKAIKVMRNSITESRTDGKSTPAVGAVLLKDDGTFDTAFRSEIRDGDHAEYTLLERKNRATKLDGAILFTTLEPCAPGARNHPKLSCAERIVLARIKEIWIGISDPDPTVDRKGIKYLQDNNITVQMFDRDLQEVIRDVNKEFIEQATERAMALKLEKRSKPISLSSLENALEKVEIQDFSEEALNNYRESAKIIDKVGSQQFNRRLVQQGLLKIKNKIQTPTGFGLLLFGQEPRVTIPQAGLLGTVYYPDEKEEIKDFDGPMVLIPTQVESWLKDKLPITIDRNKMHRTTRTELPFSLIREAVVNALIHRDYDLEGAKCQMEVKPETLIIKSPGAPLSPITLEQLQEFKAPMLSRNPKLHYVFAKMQLAEERGLGMRTFNSIPAKYDLPLPRYSWADPYLILTLYRSKEGAMLSLDPDIVSSMSADEKNVWQFIILQSGVTSSRLVEHFNFDERKAQRILKKFMELGLIKRIGKGPSTKYEIIYTD